MSREMYYRDVVCRWLDGNRYVLQLACDHFVRRKINKSSRVCKKAKCQRCARPAGVPLP